MKLKNKKQFSPSGLFCNAAVDGSKPVKMQRTEKTKINGGFENGKKKKITKIIKYMDNGEINTEVFKTDE